MKTVVALALIALVAFLAWDWLETRDLRASLTASRDSLVGVRDSLAGAQAARDSAREALSHEIDLRTTNASEASAAIGRWRNAYQRAAGELEEALAQAPETVQVVLRGAIAERDSIIDVCEGGLTDCREALVMKDTIIANDSLTILEQADLLHAFQAQLDDAIRAARPSTTTWLVRVLAVLGIISTAAHIF